MTEPLLRITGLVRHFDTRRGLQMLTQPRARHTVHAVDGVSLTLARGETLGVIGESGCGKTTLGRCVVGLTPPGAGRVMLEGRDLLRADAALRQEARRRIQMVFQNPYASLNPRHTVAETVCLPLRVHGLARNRPEAEARAAEMLERVGLRRDHLPRYPHQFSGGQRQRIAIARALVARPDIVVCDEAVSALDVSVQAQILALLAELQAERGIAYLFISHNLGVVGRIADRLAVMYLGLVVEEGPAREVLRKPLHPYAEALVAAAPRARRAEAPPRRLPGEPPSPLDPPGGCRFHPRCPHAMARCATEVPVLRPQGAGRSVACHLHG
jgi:oligopeptide/dipeptide ABC transporter ATP-binding protein